MGKGNKSALVTLVIGLALNILLGAGKLVVGIITDYAAVKSDAVNNISDAAVSVVTIVATALAARGADSDHPYGHGRYEYIAAFVVGAVVLAVGVEVLIAGVRRAITPAVSEMNTPLIIVMSLSIAVKLGMACMYFVRGKKSGTLKAAGVDSASDAAVTTAVLGCTFIQHYTGMDIDGYAAIAVSLVILVCAFKILRSTVSRLVGERADPALCEQVKRIILSHPAVLSVHDIIINDYGSANKIAEADAVFSSDMSFVAVHDVCDGLEREVLLSTGVKLSLHADPSADGRAAALAERLSEVLSPYGVTAHDIRIDDGQKTVCFDISVGAKVPVTEVCEQAKACAKAFIPYDVTVEVDY